MQEKTGVQRCYLPTRHVLFVLLLCAFFTTQTAQVSLNIAIVAMVHPSVWNKAADGIHKTDSCPSPNANSTGDSTQEPTGRFMWDAQTQGLILGAMFYGSVLTHVVGGRIAERWGGKWPFGASLLLPALLCFLIPTAARLGPEYIFGVRVLQGLAEGVMGPAYWALLAVWTPCSERNTMASYALTGTILGTATTMTMTGYISSHSSLGGWPTVFYFSGLLGCVWFIFWAVLVHNTPEEHPRINAEELSHIRESLKQDTLTNEDKPVPWRKIMTSGAFWSLVVFRTSTFWEANTTNTALPLYLETVLHLPIEKNGVMMGLLNPASLTGGLLGGLLADHLRKKSKFRVTSIHKGFALLGMMLSGISWLLLPEAHCDILWVFILMLSSKFFHTLCIGSVQVAFVDMAPQYAGTLGGVVLTLGDCTGFLSPLLTGVLTEKDVSMERWSYVFYVNVGIVSVGLLMFLIFGSAERQKWAQTEDSEKTPLVTKKTFKIPF